MLALYICQHIFFGFSFLNRYEKFSLGFPFFLPFLIRKIYNIFHYFFRVRCRFSTRCIRVGEWVYVYLYYFFYQYDDIFMINLSFKYHWRMFYAMLLKKEEENENDEHISKFKYIFILFWAWSLKIWFFLCNMYIWIVWMWWMVWENYTTPTPC